MNSPAANLKKVVQNFLLHYRNTPHPTKGKSPAELMFNRQLNTRLSQLRPERKSAKEGGDVLLKGTRKFEPNESVWARNYATTRKWLKGVITEVVGPLTYRVKVGEKLWKRHVDQLRIRAGSSSEVIDDNAEDNHKFDEFQTGPPAQQQPPPVRPAQPNPQPPRQRNRRIPVLVRQYPLRNKNGPQQQQN